jgi:hypothetical protein
MMALMTRITKAIFLAHTFLLRINIPEMRKRIFIVYSLAYEPSLKANDFAWNSG